MPLPTVTCGGPTVSRFASASGRIPLAELREGFQRAPLVPGGLLAQLLRFGVIGLASTLAYGVAYLLLRLVMGAQPANLLALLVTAVANTAANRRLTFGITGRRHVGRHHLQGLAVFGLGLALTSGSLAVLHAVAAAPARPVELVVLVAANLAATALRFVLLRAAMHHRR